MALSFTEIQKTVSSLSFADPRALMSSGLGKLAAIYDAYPMKSGKDAIFILIKRGLTPKKAGAMSEVDAIGSVLLLQQENGKWRRIWPLDQTAEPTQVASQ